MNYYGKEAQQAPKSMTFEEAVDYYQEDLDTIIQGQHWDDGCNTDQSEIIARIYE